MRSWPQKSILGLVQGAPCRIDVDFTDEKGQPYKKTAVVKAKGGETEELPLYTDHDSIFGHVSAAPDGALGPAVLASTSWHTKTAKTAAVATQPVAQCSDQVQSK